MAYVTNTLGVVKVPNFVIPLPSIGDQDDSTAPGTTVKARISHYWPPLGGTNCSQFVDGQCISRMASGEPWQEWVEEAVACPPEYPFGTKFTVLGKTWVCMDRGGAIQVVWGWIREVFTKTIWLDLLTPSPPVPFGTIVDVTVNENEDTVIANNNTQITGFQFAYYIKPQKGWKKLVFNWYEYWGLISPGLIVISQSSTPEDGETIPEPITAANCEDSSTPCLFPLENGLSSYVVGTSANGGLDCHTSGGPTTIMGWDYWTPERTSGSTIYATHDGYVDWAGIDGIQNTVIQISNDKWLTTYMHMETTYVVTGQKVNQGDSIGKMGNVGYSDWPHLHYAMYQKNVGPVCNQISWFK